MTPSLRTSLTVWFGGFASLVVGTSSAVLYLGVRNALFAGVDAKLEATANAIGALCEWEDGGVHLEGLYGTTGPESPLTADQGFEVRLQPTGTLQIAEGMALPPPRSGHTEGPATYGDLRINAVAMTHPMRGARPAPHHEPSSPGFTVVVRAAASLLPLRRQLATIRWIALAVAGASVAAAVAFGLFVSRRVTTPLDRLGTAAALVRDGAANAIPRSGTGDEIDRLAALFDQAFEAVRGSVEQQRRFVADASHELRTPVATICSLAEVGRRRPRSATEYRELLHEIERVAQRMASMLASLLALARLDAAGRMPGAVVDLVEVARRAVEDTPSDKSVEIETSPAEVMGDPHLLAMLCSNLLSNAVRHATERVHLTVARSAQQVVIRIADDGPGLSGEDRERAFERFFRGDRARGAGAGLGLALVRSIARAHGGECRIQAVSRGLCLEVILPAAS